MLYSELMLLVRFFNTAMPAARQGYMSYPSCATLSSDVGSTQIGFNIDFKETYLSKPDANCNETVKIWRLETAPQ